MTYNVFSGTLNPAQFTPILPIQWLYTSTSDALLLLLC